MNRENRRQEERQREQERRQKRHSEEKSSLPLNKVYDDRPYRSTTSYQADITREESRKTEVRMTKSGKDEVWITDRTRTEIRDRETGKVEIRTVERKAFEPERKGRSRERSVERMRDYQGKDRGKTKTITIGDKGRREKMGKGIVSYHY